jgi:hypothetical protein
MNVILGDNPFFDINHKTGGSDLGFQGDAMGAVIADFVKHGGTKIMLSDHLELHEEVFDVLKEYKNTDLSLVLLAPVPHTINALVAAGGYKALLNNVGVRSLITISIGLLCQLLKLTNACSFFYRLSIKNYVKNQLRPYKKRNLNVSHFGLHNVFADMLLASKNINVLNSFICAVEDLGLKPVILTQNMGSFLSLGGIRKCTMCGSVNPLGYMMSPGKQATEKSVKENPYNHLVWAMQVLAGGSVGLNGSLDYLNDLNVQNFVYATSKPDRITELFKLLK